MPQINPLSSMTGLRVLHVLDHSLPITSGYSIRSHAILRAQQQLGLAPIAVTSAKHPSEVASESIDGVTYLRLRGRALGGRRGWNAALVVARLAPALLREIRRRGVSLVHAHSPALCGLAALWAARRAGIPLVYEVRALWEDAAVDGGTQAPDSRAYRLSRGLESWLLRHSDATVAICQGLGEEILKRGGSPEKLGIVWNGVDTARLEPMEPDPVLTERYALHEAFVVGYVGSFLRFEGLDVLLTAFAALARELAHARLLLVGDGEMAAELPRLIAALGIERQVILAGNVAHAEIRRWYSLCDILVFPRRASRLTELTTPLKPLEAMAMAIAVVGSDVGGLRELIHEGETGLLCRPEDPGDLARVLSTLAHDPQRRRALGDRARRWVCAERDWRQVVAEHVRIYARVLGPPAGGPAAARED